MPAMLVASDVGGHVHGGHVGMLKVLSYFSGRFRTHCRPTTPELPSSSGQMMGGAMMWGVGQQARVKGSSGELPQQCIIQVMEIRSRLQQSAAAAPFRYHSRPGRRAPAEIVPRDPAAPRVEAGTAVERLMGILSPLGLPIPGHLQPDVDSAHPVIDLPVAEILKYIAADPRREVLGPGALPQRHSGISARHRRS